LTLANHFEILLNVRQVPNRLCRLTHGDSWPFHTYEADATELLSRVGVIDVDCPSETVLYRLTHKTSELASAWSCWTISPSAKRSDLWKVFHRR